MASVDDSDIEWLDVGPDREPSRLRAALAPSSVNGPGGGWFGGGSGGWRRWRWWYALLALALIGLLVAGVGSRHSSAERAASSPSPSSPSPSVPNSAASSSPAAASSSATGAPVAVAPAVVSIGHPVLGITAGWELFASGQGVVVRIQPALGLVTTTAVPGLASNGPVSFILGPDRAIIRPQDSVAGYQVSDGQPAVQLPAALDRGGVVLPGPDSRHVWVEVNNGPNLSTTVMALVGIDGTDANVSIPIPSDAGLPITDRAGYLYFYGTGGIYDARPSGVARITTGELLAGSATRWLTIECDDQHRCGTVVIDRSTNARYSLPIPVTGSVRAGAIAPDGTTAALLEADSSDSGIVHLVDLRTGIERSTSVALYANQGGGDQTFAWSPDSAWLFVTSKGKLVAINSASGQPVDLGLNLPTINQVAVRPAVG
jgi:hypothetical protein